ncbi:Outer membrane protein assembly factor BamA [Salinimicrobium catena]|uniref:Outer membrane protein assembly factor BamA n=1 Tax=Salinimicrobium catena TaxID=390640 RepID=A0A1H5LSV7_9FLAO|nr:BamA/TamA family outer membrane protein [Salinimicrobium catena]SDL14003.1 Outer membrane protein assembly factor BamA [Salinimicrobium catena]SEE80152.1 Outer membrane protein assembly factor BamA [Salinimicrobium catena]
MLKTTVYKLLFLGMLIPLIHACSVKHFIPEGKLLYTGAEVELTSEDEIANKKELQSQLKGLITPEPNSKFLGSRFGLYFYYKAQKEKPGFINKFFNKRFGEEPVYLSDADPFQTEEILKNRLENRGYFFSRVDHSVEENQQKKTAKVFYTARLPEEPYILESYQLDNDSLQIFKEIKETLPDAVLKEGEPFNLSIMKLERERIDRELKKRGYYNFSSNFLIFEADTNQYDRKKFDLFLRLKQDVPEAGIKPYRVKRVNVYPNYVVGTDTLKRDSVRYEEKNYIQNVEFFKPKYLDPYILLEEGELYDPAASSKTSRRLTSLGAYKFVNIRYDELDSLSTDSLGYLEANIFLSPLNKRSIRAELQAVTKSNNFAGPHLALTYTNRNLFHGGEILNISGKVGFERQLASGSQEGLTSTQFGVDTDLIFPRMLFPLKVNNDWFKYSIPKTKISAGFEYLHRSDLFSLFSVTGSFGYIWRANRYVTHELNPFSVNYVRLSKTTETFDDILKANPFLQSSFDQQFIAGLTYSFIYNGMVDVNKKHQFFANTNFDLAGNTLDLLSNGETPKRFLGLEFAQYVKIDTDLRYHFLLTDQQKIATRLFAGIGIPYGNSEVMPFSRQFFAGGPYSVRAFRIRSLGPGSYEPDEENVAHYDQVGNIRLEANVEYRFPIYQFLKGAVFADAGNVWNTKETTLEGGKFSSDFINELGIGVGAGLRIDIQSFVIRFDLAAPVHIPWLPKGERWDFRFDEPVLNFAIGYPF